MQERQTMSWPRPTSPTFTARVSEGKFSRFDLNWDGWFSLVNADARKMDHLDMKTVAVVGDVPLRKLRDRIVWRSWWHCSWETDLEVHSRLSDRNRWYFLWLRKDYSVLSLSHPSWVVSFLFLLIWCLVWVSFKQPRTPSHGGPIPSMKPPTSGDATFPSVWTVSWLQTNGG